MFQSIILRYISTLALSARKSAEYEKKSQVAKKNSRPFALFAKKIRDRAVKDYPRLHQTAPKFAIFSWGSSVRHRHMVKCVRGTHWVTWDCVPSNVFASRICVPGLSIFLLVIVILEYWTGGVGGSPPRKKLFCYCTMYRCGPIGCPVLGHNKNL